ncbi:hypothetical protein MRX96_047332 [Rhipicephalus microplus]
MPRNYHVHCCAKWCSSSGRSGTENFFKVLTDHRFEAWLYYANPTDLQDTPRAQVDATPVLWFMHFTKDCFTISDRKKAHAGSSPLCEGAGAEAQVLGASRHTSTPLPPLTCDSQHALGAGRMNSAGM